MKRLQKHHASTALAYSQARTIKLAYMGGRIERKKLAEIYKVSLSTICNILVGKYDDGKGANVI